MRLPTLCRLCVGILVIISIGVVFTNRGMLFLRICNLFLLCVVSSGYGLSARGNLCSVLAGCFVDKLVILY